MLELKREEDTIPAVNGWAREKKARRPCF